MPRFQRFLARPPVRFAAEVALAFSERNVTISAAALAYYLLLTVFPLLIMLSAILAMLRLDIAAVAEGLRPFVPEAVNSLVENYLTYIAGERSAALFAAGLVVMVSFSSAGFRVLLYASRRLYHQPRPAGFWFFAGSVVFSLVLLLVAYASVAVILTGSWFFRMVENVFHVRIVVLNWQWMRFLLLFGLLFLFLALFYRAVAPRAKPRPPVLVGAIITAVLLVGASMVFSWFITLSSRYSLVYGSLASLIITMVWLYLCGNVLILGSVFNSVWYRRRTAPADLAPRPARFLLYPWRRGGCVSPGAEEEYETGTVYFPAVLGREHLFLPGWFQTICVPLGELSALRLEGGRLILSGPGGAAVPVETEKPEDARGLYLALLARRPELVPPPPKNDLAR